MIHAICFIDGSRYIYLLDIFIPRRHPIGIKEDTMRIEIKALGFKLTDTLRTFIREHIIQVLARRADAIQSVVVRLSDLNGPRGGEDKLCRIQIDLFGARMQFVQAARADAYAAITSACRRASRNVNRTLEQQPR
jgi:putative sigma-54 modulation protein